MENDINIQTKSSIRKDTYGLDPPPSLNLVGQIGMS